MQGGQSKSTGGPTNERGMMIIGLAGAFISEVKVLPHHQLPKSIQDQSILSIMSPLHLQLLLGLLKLEQVVNLSPSHS